VTSLAANAQTTINQRLIGRDLQSIRKGTSSAQKLTLSFWVKSNVTGTYVVDIFDDDNTRNVSATYTISAADTWENKTITFPEDTGGSILTMDSNVSLQPIFWLVAGTDYTSAGVLQTTWGAATASSRAVGQLNLAAATNNYYQITGIQMETGSIATAFEFEPYERTLSKCHFYYYRATVDTIGDHFGSGFNKTTTAGMFYTPFPGRMRAAPTALEQSGTATDYAIAHANTSTACSSVPTFESATVSGASTNFTVSSGLTAGQGSMAKADTTNAYLAWSAEL
jgi:hypothetical protein